MPQKQEKREINLNLNLRCYADFPTLPSFFFFRVHDDRTNCTERLGLGSNMEALLRGSELREPDLLLDEEGSQQV